jgi:hypothetical protein
LLAVAGAAKAQVVDRVVLLTVAALAGISLLSFVYFFPVPGVFTALAAVLALVALGKVSPPARGNFELAS